MRVLNLPATKHSAYRNGRSSDHICYLLLLPATLRSCERSNRLLRPRKRQAMPVEVQQKVRMSRKDITERNSLPLQSVFSRLYCAHIQPCIDRIRDDLQVQCNNLY